MVKTFPDIVRLGERLAEERQRLGFTQGKLAASLGLSRNSITQYEAGRHQPGADVLIGLDKVGADSQYILTGRRSTHSSIPPDRDRLAVALQEARRQLGLPEESFSQREILDRAWVIYLALETVLLASKDQRQAISRL